MKVKELLKTVNVAWSPPAQQPILLAAGTAAQQLDASFSTASTLELYSLNLQQPGYDMELKASVASDHRFHKIIWGSHGTTSNNASGVIVGGCDKGTIKIYSAAKLLNNDPHCLISSRDRHTGAVRAMDFNPFKSNLLATGASDNEIFIWDIENTETPMKPGTCAKPQEDVQHVAWNKQVQHILASTFSQRCMIWDLRKNEAIIKLSNTSADKVRWKVVEWHPDKATQLCLASEDDQEPVIELWDLRHATLPWKVLKNHQRGVLSIAWCPHDSDLLLSCSKDNRILCWNPNSDVTNGEVICELAQTTQWNFDVSWCPRHPGLIAASSFDGHAVIYSLLGGRHQEIMDNSSKIADSFPGLGTNQFTQPPHPGIRTEMTAELKKAPKWLKRPFGATFGFGGKLTIFENEAQYPDGQQSSKIIWKPSVYVSSIITNPELIQRSAELDGALKSMQYSDFCKRRIERTDDEHEKKVWKCISTYFEEDDKKEMLLELGYNVDAINHKLKQYVPQDVNEVTQGISRMGTVHNGDAFDGSAAFDAIAEQEQNRISPVTKQTDNFQINTSDDEEGLITQAILMNNIEAAVALCFASKKYAEAIILAMAGGADLLARTHYKYFSEHSGPLNSLINSLVSENWSEVAANCDINCWKETLVGIFIHCNDEERSTICDILGDRLLASKNPVLKKQAQICYICSGNLTKLVDSVESNIEEVVELLAIMQKGLEYKGTRQVRLEGKVATVMATYAEMLASEGSFEAALNFLQTSNSQEPKIVQLRDRLNRSLGHVQTEPQRTTSRMSNQGYFDPMRRMSQSSNFGTMLQQPTTPLPQPMNQWNTDPTRHSVNSYLTSQVPPQYNPPVVPNITNQPPLQTQFPPQQNSCGQMAPVSSYQAVPPPPPSASVVTTSRPPSVGPTSRPKHVIDPSIKPSSTYGAPTPFAQTSPLYPTPNYPSQPTNPMYPTGPANTTFFNPNEADTNQSSALSGPMGPQNYGPPRSQQIPKYQEDVYRGDPQSGWNDPPNLKTSRMQQPLLALINNNEMSAEHAGTRKWKEKRLKSNTFKEKADYQPQDPILHPLGNVPQQDLGMPPQENYYQQDPRMPYNQQYNQMPGQMYNRPMDMYNQPVQPAQIVKPPEPEKPKAPIPDEHIHLKTVLDELRIRCLEHAKNPQTKRKVEEVSKKLEVLYDCLRENKLSSNTLQGLHQISHFIQNGDYTSGLGLHTQLVSGSDFSQIASFMPGIKVLLQSALQLGVYIR